MKTSEARKVIRAADLPPPHRVSDEHFDVICITFKVERSDRQALRQRLDEIADAFLGLERRIAKLLLHRLAEMDQTAALRLSIRISQRSLGELVGGSRERINKILHEWRRSGIIALEHGSIQICDRQALTDLV